MSWCFRLRLELGATAKLQCEDIEWIIRDTASIKVHLRPADDQRSLAQARSLALYGGGFATEAEAEAAGAQWRDWLIIALAATNVGADFGDRAATGMFTEHGLKFVEATTGRRALNDVHGLMVYECEPSPHFARLGAAAIMVSKPHERLEAALEAAVAAKLELTTRERLAYDLYAASFSESNADARFLLLMMAVETLLEPQPRSSEAQALVEQLLLVVRKSGLPQPEITSIAGALKWLRCESISQAGRRLASCLGERMYQSETAGRFFTRCYELRSKLVHGSDPRPQRGEVATRAANLELFVSHLLAGRLLDDLPT